MAVNTSTQEYETARARRVKEDRVLAIKERMDAELRTLRHRQHVELQAAARSIALGGTLTELRQRHALERKAVEASYMEKITELIARIGYDRDEQ